MLYMCVIETVLITGIPVQVTVPPLKLLLILSREQEVIGVICMVMGQQ